MSDPVTESVEVMGGNAQTQLRSVVERVERLNDEVADLKADLKEVYAEAKGNGFNSKIIRKVVKHRAEAANKAKRDEEAALLDLYLSALGEV